MSVCPSKQAEPDTTLPYPDYALLRGIDRVRERAQPFAYTERHLQCVWADEAFRPKQLLTREGESVTVLSSGRWNLEAGPDFLDAVLVLEDGRRVSGDVEIHIRPRDWQSHGHTGDPRYERVVAHVTYYPRRGPQPHLPAGCCEISLAEALEARNGFSFEAIDVSAYPFATVTPVDPPCAQIIRRWPQARQGAFLDQAGQFRIEAKARRMALQLPGLPPAEILYRETMRALGYRPNAMAFHALATIVPLEDLRSCASLTEAYALLLGTAGLLPERIPSGWPLESRRFLRKIWDLFWSHGERWTRRRLSSDVWQLSNIRPTNSPPRRLAAAAVLFGPTSNWATSVLEAERSPRTLARELVTQATPDPDSPLAFWSNHLSLASEATRPTALIGITRASSIATNVIVPHKMALGSSPAAILKQLPASQIDSHARRAAHAIFGRDHNPAFYVRSGLRHQGLLQIYHDFCITHSGICSQCRLPPALREQQQQKPSS